MITVCPRYGITHNPPIPMDPETSSASASAFIRALYDDESRCAVLAVGRGETKSVVQRLFPAADLRKPTTQAWLRHLNAKGHDIFIGMNPMRPDTRGRTKADVLAVARLQLDLDEDGPSSLRKVLADAAAGALPIPAIVVRSSADHYQVLWHTAPGWSSAAAEATMDGLAVQYGGDNVSDISRCMRLPGFRNKKDGRDDAPVVWTDYGGGPVKPSQFSLPPTPARERTVPSRSPRRKGRPPSQSERDYAVVCRRLERGDDPAAVRAWLAEARPEKHNPADYAERTVRNALVRLEERSASMTR